MRAEPVSGAGRRGPRPVVHVGVHKALSSWLQHEVFRPDGPISTPDVRIRAVVQQFVTIRTGITDRPDWLCRLDELRRAGVQTGLSAERLSGYPAMGLFGRSEIVRNLAQDLPDARILIVVREQVSAIVSYYQQYLHDGGSRGLGRFLVEPELHEVVRAARFDPRYYCYMNLVRAFDEAFGAGSVLVVPYELFVRDRDRWRDLVESHLGLSLAGCDFDLRVNAGRRWPLQAAHRAINAHFVSTQLSPGGPLQSDVPRRLLERAAPTLDRAWPEAWHRRHVHAQRRVVSRMLEGFYAADNVELAARTGLDLDALGYG